MLEKTNLLPGRRVLHEQTKEKFDLLMKNGISNLYELVRKLSSPEKINQLSSVTGIPVHYLTILRREINRLLPKAVSLANFPGIEKSMITELNKKNIHNTIQLFEKGDNTQKRKELALEIAVPVNRLEELMKLADLSRIWGVGPIFSRIFFETGTDTVKKVASAEPQTLYDQLAEVNRAKQYTTAKFTVKDVALCIECAINLPHTIEI